MDNEIIPKSGLLLRKIGRRYMIVEACDGQANLTNVFSLNETAAKLWRRIGEGPCTVAALGKWLAELYGIPEETAQADVARQVDEWRNFGLIA